MLRCTGLLWFGLADIIYLAGIISKMTSNMVDYSSRDSPYGSYEHHGVGNSSDLVDTLRSLKVEIKICKEDNDKIIHAHEKKSKVNLVIL